MKRTVASALATAIVLSLLLPAAALATDSQQGQLGLPGAGGEAKAGLETGAEVGAVDQPVLESAGAPVREPAQQPEDELGRNQAGAPVRERSQGPADELGLERAEESAEKPELEPAQGPVDELGLGSAQGPVDELGLGSAQGPADEPGLEPVDEALQEAARESANAPELAPGLAPGREPVQEPAEEPTQEPRRPDLLDQGASNDGDNDRPVGVIKKQIDGSQGFCTGTLIGRAGESQSKWVLSARHCFVDDDHAYDPRITTDPESLYFYPSVDGTGQAYQGRNIIVDKNSDLALVELQSFVPRAPWQVAAQEPGRGKQFESFGYGADKSKPNTGKLRRNVGKMAVSGYISQPSVFCGDLMLTGHGAGIDAQGWSAQNIQGDSGGPAVADGNQIVGVMSGGEINAFYGPKGELLLAQNAQSGSSFWVAASVIKRFVYDHREKLGFDFGPGWESGACEGRSPLVSATILSSTDPDGRWAAAVQDGQTYFFHPSGWQNRVEELGAPVVFNVRRCYLNHAGCTTSIDWLLPPGWQWVSGADPTVPAYAHSGAQWVKTYYESTWGSNDAAAKFPGRPTGGAGHPAISRMGGASRVDTAAAVYRQSGYREQSRHVVLVSGDNFADAVVAAPLAASYGTGILLTCNASARLEGAVVQALEYGGVTSVLIVGSTGSISRAKEEELRARGLQVSRLGGADRFATSVAVGKHLRGRGFNRVALMADHEAFPDALAAGAAAGQRRGIVLLTRAELVDGAWLDQTPAAVQDLALLQAERYSVGGGAYKAAFNWDGLKPVVGYDRYETAASLARAFSSQDNVVAATGDNFPDALTAGALAANRQGVLLLVPTGGASAHARVLGRELDVDSLTVVGGPRSLSDQQVLSHVR
ncbi:cell wall-binding repeat-containing protein [Buchananella felis]|uniref:cell wall-binding repeat-containing protein n=1 Tax=Buchananella felis TaxID=3231492 RepID=UPI003526EF1E